VIDRISKGRNVARLLYYLYGPGRSDEHENPHLVAGWRDPIASLEPPIKPDGQRDFRLLAGLLNAPLDMIGRRGRSGTVWHCVLSAAPTDRLLTDAEWNTIADEFMHQMGLARRDDPAGVRWVAVRHGLSKGGIDHIHVVATLARQDGDLPYIHNDFIRARRACQAIEKQFGLTATAPADRTAAVRPTRAENERSARNGQVEPERITLRRLVQDAAAVAVSEADFFARLRDAGALIRERRSDTDPEQITGYAVALPGHTTRSSQPIWYSGGKLAPDLTLPKLRRRWERSGNAEQRSPLRAQDMSPRSVRAVLRSSAASAADHAQNEAGFFDRLGQAGILIRYRYSDRDPGEVTGYAVTVSGHLDARDQLIWYSGGRLGEDLTLPRLRRLWKTGAHGPAPSVDPYDRQVIWDDVIQITTNAAAQFRQLTITDYRSAADTAMVTADALRISARVIRGAAGRDLRRAADEFDRAAREAYGVIPRLTPPGDLLRTTTSLLATLRTTRGSPGLGLAMLIVNLAELVSVAAVLRQMQGRIHQAAAAQTAADRLSRLAHSTTATPTAAPSNVPGQAARASHIARLESPAAGIQRQAPYRPQSSRPGRPPSRSRRPQGPAP